jgi:hypothetical protein
MNNINNGRVNIKSPNISELFQMYDKIPVNTCATFRNPTEGLWDDTSLSKAYFSQENIQIIQNGIRAGVYERSNGQYIIGIQDCESLKIIMRSIFLQHSSNQPFDIPQQIYQLNKIVLNYCIQQVYSEAQGYMKYVDDVSTLVVPISNPIQACNNDRTIEFKKWF